MSKSSFLNHERPLLVSMIQARTPERVEELMERSLEEGAEAFGIQFCKLEGEYRNRETYKAILEKAGDVPVYATNYRLKRGCADETKSDDALGEELLEIARCGATLCDVMGDYFDPCAGELTEDPSAVKKQMELIERLHGEGAEVLMSSHVLKFIPAEEVLKIAMEHQRRGADICKIVTGASTMAEQIENLRIINMLKENLDIPFLFLSGGECHITRRIGGIIGSCMSLCVAEHDELSTKSQPLLREMKLIREYMDAKNYI